MRVYIATLSAPLLFQAEDDEQARLILQHIAEGVLDAPLPHGAVWTAPDETTLAESILGGAERPVFTDRAGRYAPVEPAAAGDCPICAGHARRQNYPRRTTEESNQ